MKYLVYILSLSILLVSCNKKESEVIDDSPIEKEPIIEQYGFILNDYQVVYDTIKKGDTFGKILTDNGLDATSVYNVTENIKNEFDIRNIRVGHPYVMLKSKDKKKNLQAFIYEKDKIDYYVVDFRDSVAIAYKKSKPVSIKRRIVAAKIDGSLSATLDSEGASTVLTHELSQMYAWSVDFFKIQKDDYFAVVFNEKYINDTLYAGIENIEGSFFVHKGKKYYAFPFRKDTLSSRVDYYDEEGKALKNMFLKAPLKFSRISSRFSPKRFHPVQKTWKAHKGTDYAAPHGTPIMSTAHGTVIETGYTSGNGNYVKVKHNQTYTTQYLHMSKIAAKKGQRVSQGDIIGYVGSTGLATGPHVCYRFWKNGEQVDPLKQVFTNSEPLEQKYKPRYMSEITPIRAQLDSIANVKFKG